MPKGFSYFEALLGMLLLSSVLVGAYSGVLKALQSSHQSLSYLQQQMLLTDLFQSSLQQSSRCDGACDIPNPAWQLSLTAMQLAMPATEFHVCHASTRISWYAEHPDPRYATFASCQLGDNQGQEVSHGSGL
ncbi:MAG TPA: hypothetical protein DCS87_10165 [Rheinheimera sp.]|nr:hypothetical protein [Rheinheimera sp.]